MDDAGREEELATAYHEAGHFVVARILQEQAPSVRLADLSARRDAEGAGGLELGFDAVGTLDEAPPFGFPAAASETLEWALVSIHLAGREAQWLGTGKRPVHGHLDDWIEARLRTLRLLHPEAPLRELAESIQDAADGDDWETVAAILRELSREYPDVKARLHRERESVKQLLVRHRPALEALAEGLFEQGRLTAAQADALLSATTAPHGS